MTSVEEKESLMELPPSEKVVAVALKYIFDEIKRIEKQESDEINSIQISLSQRFRAIEDRVNDIVNGAALTPEDLAGKEKYFTESELGAVEQAVAESKGIPNYWFTAFKNHFGDDMTAEDNDIALGLLRCAAKSFEDRIEIEMTFDNNSHFPAGTFIRKFFIINGLAHSYGGDEPAWIGARPDSIFGKLFTSCSNSDPELLTELFELCSEVMNGIIPGSLLNFLGVVDDEEEEEGEEEDEEDMEGEPNKMMKP